MVLSRGGFKSNLYLFKGVRCPWCSAGLSVGQKDVPMLLKLSFEPRWILSALRCSNQEVRCSGRIRFVVE